MADTCDLTSYDELAGIIENLPLLLREHRRAHRLTLAGVGDKIGVAPSTVLRFEKGVGGISTDSLVRLLRYLGATTGEAEPDDTREETT